MSVGAAERSVDAKTGLWALADVGVGGASCCPGGTTTTGCGACGEELIGSESLMSFPSEGDSSSLTEAKPLVIGDKMLDTKPEVSCIVTLGLLRMSLSMEVSTVRF